MVQVHRTEYYRDFAEFTRSFFATQESSLICFTLYESDQIRDKQLEYLEGFWQHLCQVQTARIEVRSGESQPLVSEIEEYWRNGIRAISVLGIPVLPGDQFVELARGVNARRERIRQDGVLVMFWLTPSRLPEFAQRAPDLMSIARVYAVSDEKYTISMDLVGDQIKHLEEKYKVSTSEFVQRWAKGRLSELAMSEEDKRLWLLLAEATRDEVDVAR